MSDDLRQSVLAAARRPEVRQAVADLYTRVQHAIDERRPICELSGRCCRFEEFGHRLFVTTLELAAFFHGLPTSRRQFDSTWTGAGCPFQSGKLCSVHLIRPFGCRMFFCDASSAEWQNAEYERFHAQIKRLHETLGVPYAYVEWRQALKALTDAD